MRKAPGADWDCYLAGQRNTDPPPHPAAAADIGPVAMRTTLFAEIEHNRAVTDVSTGVLGFKLITQWDTPAARVGNKYALYCYVAGGAASPDAL